MLALHLCLCVLRYIFPEMRVSNSDSVKFIRNVQLAKAILTSGMEVICACGFHYHYFFLGSAAQEVLGDVCEHSSSSR